MLYSNRSPHFFVQQMADHIDEKDCHNWSRNVGFICLQEDVKWGWLMHLSEIEPLLTMLSETSPYVQATENPSCIVSVSLSELSYTGDCLWREDSNVSLLCTCKQDISCQQRAAWGAMSTAGWKHTRKHRDKMEQNFLPCFSSWPKCTSKLNTASPIPWVDMIPLISCRTDLNLTRRRYNPLELKQGLVFKTTHCTLLWSALELTPSSCFYSLRFKWKELWALCKIMNLPERIHVYMLIRQICRDKPSWVLCFIFFPPLCLFLGSVNALMRSYLHPGCVGVNSSSKLSVVILAGGLPSRLM